MRMIVVPILNGVFRMIHKDLLRGLEELELRGLDLGPSKPQYEIDQNTEKSPGDLMRLAVMQTLVKDHQLKLV